MAQVHPRFSDRLGHTGLTVSRLCLGTVNFGGRVTEVEANDLLDHALASGVNFIDTANIYGWRVYRGWTEEILGSWLSRAGRRDRVVVATKFGAAMSSHPGPGALTVRGIVAACDASLTRLRSDRIDLYQLHCVTDQVRWDVVWEAMELLVRQGKVRYVGTSNTPAWQLARAQEAAARRGSVGLVSEQCCYNLVERRPETELMAAARAYGVSVLAWSPLHGGLLGGALRKLASGLAVKSAQGRAQEALPTFRNSVAAFEATCREMGRSEAEVGVGWVLARPGVTAAVIGPRTREQFDQLRRAVESPLSVPELHRIESLFPNAGGSTATPPAVLPSAPVSNPIQGRRSHNDFQKSVP